MRSWKQMAAGFGAGCVTGLFGGGGGMILIPLLTLAGGLQEEEVFPASLSIILPICLTSLLMSGSFPWQAAVPYLLGSGLGGFLAGKWGQKIPALWLHRGLGVLILWGGFRYLW